MLERIAQIGNLDKRCLLSAAFHHLCEKGDAVQIYKLLGERDVPGEAGQVLQCFQLGIHTRRLDPFMELLGILSLAGERQTEECSQREAKHTKNPCFVHRETETQSPKAQDYMRPARHGQVSTSGYVC